MAKNVDQQGSGTRRPPLPAFGQSNCISINQSATMGFSANLAYSVTRCEPSGAYLMGKQELFNDRFSGPGYVVYETLPHAGKKTGIFGRGIEGIFYTLCQVLGICHLLPSATIANLLHVD